MDITFDSVYSKCHDLSSYEAGRGVTAADELYTTIHITDRDKPFIKTYVEQAAMALSSILRFAITDYSINSTSGDVTFTIITDSSLNSPKSTTLVTEIISVYCMSVWLSNKIAERAQAYSSMYSELLNALVKSVHRKRPTLLAD